MLTKKHLAALIMAASAAFGASIFGASAMNSCAWQCMLEHNACVESGTNERYCENQYKSCRSQC